MKPTPLHSVSTLTALMEANRGIARSISYLEAEHEAHTIAYGELYERALAILRRLQRLGRTPATRSSCCCRATSRSSMLSGRRSSAASCRCRSPPASATSIGTSCCASRASSAAPTSTPSSGCSSASRASRASTASAALYEALRRRAFLVDELDELRRQRQAASRLPAGPGLHSVLLGLDQRAQGRGAHARQPDGQHPRLDRGRALQSRGCESLVDAADARHGPDRLSPGDVRQPRALAPDADRAVRAPAAAVAAVRLTRAREHPVLAELRLSALSEGARRAADRGAGPLERASAVQRRRADQRRAVRGVPGATGACRPGARGDVSGVRSGRSLARGELSGAAARRCTR